MFLFFSKDHDFMLDQARPYASVKPITGICSSGISKVSEDKGEEQRDHTTIRRTNIMCTTTEYRSIATPMGFRPDFGHTKPSALATAYKAFLCIRISETISALPPKLLPDTRIVLAVID
ncbi:unnamed protein product [Tuber melanosporum]|uniref:(Perigord truffle) hypothetical protein n=1 Tax=Tuber melanosporum (strain Mel28) TaxID=656061 RepID=D5G8X7_TUBMM|nr:uncharacterized protein GSTUM_00004888001 [Tuber melanosporum]CAZ80970.1 unnamed protein product [Tuber melanosporum]